MKKKDLIAALARFKDDDEVVIPLEQPSVGGHACVGLKWCSGGIDWDAGRIFIDTEKPVVTQEHLDRIQKYCRRYEKLLYLYAMENNLPYMGQPLMGSKMCPKGSVTRTLKEYMKEDVEGYLSNV